MDLFLRTKRNPNDPLQPIVSTYPYFFGNGTNDLRVDTNGDFALTQGIDALDQEMAKILITERGSNPFFSIYGAQLQDLIGQKFDLTYLSAKVQSELTTALQIYQYINQTNPNLDEQILTLNTINVVQTDTLTITIQFTVTTMSNKIVGSIVHLEA